jgi:hypothetical protein
MLTYPRASDASPDLPHPADRNGVVDRQGFSPVKYRHTMSIADAVRTMYVLLTRGMASDEVE